MVARARDLFWARGYGATSIQDLVDELSLQRGSLYGAFGDKRSLYLRAVALYVVDNRAYLESLLADGPVLPALRRMLTDPAASTAIDGRPPTRGGLVGNTTAELLPGDEDALALVAGAFEGVLDVLTAALRRGQRSGEVATSATPRAQAQMMLMLFQGSALVSRGTGRRRLSAGIDAALEALRAG